MTSRDSQTSRLNPLRGVYLLALLFFALLGVWGGRLVGHVFIRQIQLIQPKSRAATLESRPAGQRNVLLIGVDRLSARTPKLESVWLVMYFPELPHFALVPLFPAPDAAKPLITTAGAESFYLEGSGKPAPHFLEGLSPRIWWSNYLVIDEIGLEALLNHIGGVELRGQHKNGPDVLNEYHLLKNSTQLQAFQIAVFQAVCARASSGTKVGQIGPLLELVEHSVVTDLDLIQELERWLEGAAGLRSIGCEFPLGYASMP